MARRWAITLQTVCVYKGRFYVLSDGVALPFSWENAVFKELGEMDEYLNEYMKNMDKNS